MKDEEIIDKMVSEMKLKKTDSFLMSAHKATKYIGKVLNESFDKEREKWAEEKKELEKEVDFYNKFNVKQAKLFKCKEKGHTHFLFDCMGCQEELLHHEEQIKGKLKKDLLREIKEHEKICVYDCGHERCLLVRRIKDMIKGGL